MDSFRLMLHLFWDTAATRDLSNGSCLFLRVLCFLQLGQSILDILEATNVLHDQRLS